MAAVRWSGKHHIIAVNFSREKNCISVKWNERIFNSCKSLEICCFCNTDRCTVKILAPDHIIGIFYFYETWIVCIFRHKRLAFFVDKIDLFFIKCPVKSVLTSSKINERNAVHLLTTEHADKFSFIRNNRTVEDSGNSLYRITSDHRVFRISPQWCSFMIFQFVLPRHVWNCRADHFIFAHIIFLLLLLRSQDFLQSAHSAVLRSPENAWDLPVC